MIVKLPRMFSSIAVESVYTAVKCERVLLECRELCLVYNQDKSM